MKPRQAVQTLPPAAEVIPYNREYRSTANAVKGWRFGVVSHLIAVFVLSCVASPLWSESTGSLYRRISNELVQEALRVQSGHPGYWDLVERAWRIDQENGDAQFLLARRYLRRQRDQQIGEVLLLDALRSERTIDDTQVVSALVELYLRQGRFDQVVSLVDRYHQGNYYDRLIEERPGQIDIGYLTAYLEAGNPWFATDYLQKLRDRFPENADIAEIDLLRSPRTSLVTLEWIDRRVRRGYDLPHRLVLDAITSTEDEDLRLELARLYFSYGGEDRLVAIPFLFADTTEMVPLVETAIRSLQDDKIALELAYRWYGDETFDRIPLETTGRATLTIDRDRDGFWEEHFTIEDRRLADWSFDAHQDGMIDLRLEIEATGGAGDPNEAVVYEAFDARVFHTLDRDSDRLIQMVEYAPYPNVSEVTRLRVAPSSTIEEMMRDEVSLDRVVEARRWQPARPFTAPAILEGPRRGERWNAYTDRVTLEEAMIQRFDRQFASSNAVMIGRDELREVVDHFGTRGLTPR